MQAMQFPCEFLQFGRYIHVMWGGVRERGVESDMLGSSAKLFANLFFKQVCIISMPATMQVDPFAEHVGLTAESPFCRNHLFSVTGCLWNWLHKRYHCGTSHDHGDD